MKRFSIFCWRALKGSISFWKSTTPGFYGLLQRGAPEEYFTTLPRRSASPQSLEGVLLRAALQECINYPPWRSSSPRRSRGVHQGLVFWEVFTTFCFFRTSPAWGFLGAVHCGTLLELSTLVLFGSSPACGFLRALHLRAF